MKLEPEKWEDRGNYRTSKLHTFSESCFVQLVEIRGKVGDHYHKKQTEIFVIVGGSGKLRIGEEEFDVKCGDVFVCPPGTVHSADGNMRIVVFKYDYVPDDTVWLEK